MSEKNSSSESSNLGCLFVLVILTLIFVTLKLTACVTWSWWIVLSPAIFGVSMYLIVYTILTIIGLGALTFLLGYFGKEKYKQWKNTKVEYPDKDDS